LFSPQGVVSRVSPAISTAEEEDAERTLPEARVNSSGLIVLEDVVLKIRGSIEENLTIAVGVKIFTPKV
jgi:hypothetical protein